MAAPIVNCYILYTLLNILLFVTCNKAPVPVICAPLGYDVKNLSAVRYWYFDSPGDKCVTNSSKTCRFYTAFCKQLPNQLSTNCTDSSVCLQQTAPPNTAYKIATYKYNPFNHLEVNGFNADFQNGQEISLSGQQKCNLSILYRFHCNSKAEWNPKISDGKSGASIPGPIDIQFNRADCKARF
ncbi:uncharacterized protein LOC141911844 [Tubulanus polymorphus]|uniref:uncharacterized protein LOC141911844 n=1 Tax=Tubulanus polymorphus TaxID=672921 RepID=UPI003DA3040F